MHTRSPTFERRGRRIVLGAERGGGVGRLSPKGTARTVAARTTDEDLDLLCLSTDIAHTDYIPWIVTLHKIHVKFTHREHNLKVLGTQRHLL